MKINMRKTMRGLWVSLILGTVAGGMLYSCTPDEIGCEQCANNYDAQGEYIGQTCWTVRCCEIYYPYECITDNW